MNNILEARVYREVERLRKKENRYTKQIKIRTLIGWLATKETPAYWKNYGTQEHNYALYRSGDE